MKWRYSLSNSDCISYFYTTLKDDVMSRTTRGRQANGNELHMDALSTCRSVIIGIFSGLIRMHLSRRRFYFMLQPLKWKQYDRNRYAQWYLLHKLHKLPGMLNCFRGRVSYSCLMRGPCSNITHSNYNTLILRCSTCMPPQNKLEKQYYCRDDHSRMFTIQYCTYTNTTTKEL